MPVSKEREEAMSHLLMVYIEVAPQAHVAVEAIRNELGTQLNRDGWSSDARSKAKSLWSALNRLCHAFEDYIAADGGDHAVE